MSPSKNLLVASLGALMLTATQPANAFFCLMMNALSNGGGGFQVNGHLGGRPFYAAGPIGFRPGYSGVPSPGFAGPAYAGGYYPPQMMPPPYWMTAPVPAAPQSLEVEAEPAITQ